MMVRRVAWSVLAAVLIAVYFAGATEHGRRINTARGRADQSGYLWDAVAVYNNWHGSGPRTLIGERNRMPMYPGFLALFYDPALSPDQFFERGKRLNILLSLALLAVLTIVFRRYLPVLPAVNLLLVVGFGYFIFKAGYVQCELLFYSLLFLAFVSMAHVLAGTGGWRDVAFAALGGFLAAAAQLTKASVLPLVAIFVAVYSVATVGTLFRKGRSDRTVRGFAHRAGVLAVFVVCFLATLYPYISNSQRVFGRYFYNVNTTFYIWYDDWPAASMGTYRHGDGVGWPTIPGRDIPSLGKYLREHTVSQIAARLVDGFRDMVVVNYQRFWIMKYLVLYLAFALLLGTTQTSVFRSVAAGAPSLVAFLVLYAVVYLLAIAFYKPISGTTSRMILAHVAPLLFSLSWLFSRPGFSTQTWSIRGVALGTQHFHLVVFLMMLFDVGFVVWPRLFADFTGY